MDGFAPAGLVESLHLGAGRRRENVQVAAGGGLERYAEEGRLTQVRRVHVMGGVGATHVEGLLRARRPRHAERLEKGLHAVEVGRPEAREKHVGDPHDRAVGTVSMACGVHARHHAPVPRAPLGRTSRTCCPGEPDCGRLAGAVG